MWNLFAVIAALCIFTAAPAFSAPAFQGSAVLFDGDTYVKQQETDKDHVRLAEFVRTGEDLDSWTKLITIRHHPRLMNPYTAAANLGKKLHEENPGLTWKVSMCNDGTEAILELATGPTEFSVYRFMKRDGYAGLVSYHFACRVPAAAPEQADLIAHNRQKWLSEITAINFDYRFARLGR